MSIVRTSHNKDNPYVCLNKKALEDPKLSWAAKGLWAYLMSRLDNWNISVVHLSKIYTEGKGGGEKAIIKLINELIKFGYCQRNQSKAEKGHFGKVEYVITEFKIISPQPSARVAVARVAQEVPPNKYIAISSNDSEANKDTPPPPPMPSAIPEGLASEEEEKLAEKLIQAAEKKGIDVGRAQLLLWIKTYGFRYTQQTIKRCLSERELLKARSHVRYLQRALSEDYFNLKGKDI